MNFKKKTGLSLIGAALFATTFVASAVTLRIGNQGDAQSLGPHSLYEHWAAQKNLQLVQWPDNGMPWKFVKLNK